ncbi:hypothetical protein M9Y10_028100 [Tritrichomonas musculus]|uniref:Protein kinase domain-containing protein n=1 Tax=Tritrichomonas musculus TaxID=1915356 RepID=A0ABR2KLP4_9EUKA
MNDFKDLFVQHGKFKEDEDDDDILNNNGTNAIRFCLAIEQSTSERVICKVFDPMVLQKDMGTEDRAIDFRWYRQLMLLREALILKELDHPTIVKFKGLDLYNTDIKYDEEDDDPSHPNPIIYLEFLENKSIQSHINRSKLDLKPVQRQICILGICAAVRFLHSRHVLHRSINPKTIWLDDNFYPKVFDFSTSREFDVSKDAPKTTLTDDATYYKAPELFEEGFNLYKDEIDIFSLGRMIYLMVTGYEPFKLDDDPSRKYASFKLQAEIVKGVLPIIPSNVSPKYRELLECCCNLNPDDRPTASEIYEAISKDEDFLIAKFTEKELKEIDDYKHKIEQFEKDHPISNDFFCYKLQL